MSKGEKNSNSYRSKRVDWAKYADYRARRSRQDLEKLCKGLSIIQLREVFSNSDKVGLLPIHWAAVHNRADMIEFMLDNGSPLRLKCKNKLFADGTALHLAAMNGSIEAAAMLLSKCKLSNDERQTQPKNLLEQPLLVKAVNEATPTKEATTTTVQPQKQLISAQTSDWLKERDSEGQTALLRSASPRSRRLDRVRDLLRKNFWSLSGRPAEMALFLISEGADWRETDTKFGMNLMHWAVIHDYDDIVSMLLSLDRPLLESPAQFQAEEPRVRNKDVVIKNPKTQQLRELKLSNTDSRKNDGYETVDLLDDSNSSSTTNNSDSTVNSSSTAGSGTQQPLVSRREQANNLISAGLRPLQLAIIYGRLKIIGILWRETYQVGSDKIRLWPISVQVGHKAQKEAQRQRFPVDTGPVERSEAELRATLLKACWTNKKELTNFIRSISLKLILAIDLTLLALVWIPACLANSSSEDDGIVVTIRKGVFIVFFCTSLALAFRVMLRSPGYLRKNSSQYFNELSLISTEHQAKPPANNVSQQWQKVDGVAEAAGQVKGQTKPNKQGNLNKVEERVRLLCHMCRCVRSSRSRHCNNCNQCIQDFDHHCIYLGCCIGRRNRVDFLLLMSMVFITAIYGTVLYSSSFNRQELLEFWHFIGLVSVAKYILIGGLASFFMLKRACLGITMYEEIRSRRIRKVFGPLASFYKAQRGSSFWRDSPDRFLTGDLPASKILANLREFFGSDSLKDMVISLLWPSDQS